jgi:uncharacterized membrane protein
MTAGGALPPNDVGTVQIRVRPNRSLSPAGWWVLYVAFVALSLTIATGFAMIGAWLVLPFAGLEILAVGGMFYWISRHAEDYDEIVIGDDRVYVTQRDGSNCARHEFQRYWTRVQWNDKALEGKPGILCIGSHGRFVEIGAGVNESARLALARRIRLALEH